VPGGASVGCGGSNSDEDDEHGSGKELDAADETIAKRDDEAGAATGKAGDGAPADRRGLLSGVNSDIMHVMDRVLRHVPKNHGATALFSRLFALSLMFYNERDAKLAARVAAEKWPDLTWREMLYRKPVWINRRVRRIVPSPEVLFPRLEGLFTDFGDILDASTRQRLFNNAAKKASRKVIAMVKAGWVTDSDGAPPYKLRAHDTDGLPLWLCSRGINANEGNVHQKFVKKFMGMQGASAELVSYAWTEWIY